MTLKNNGEIKITYPYGSKEFSLVQGVAIENDFPRHTHSCYIFMRVDNGIRKILSCGSEVHCRKGEMLFINPNLPHRPIPSKNSTPLSYRNLCISSEHLKTAASQISNHTEQLPHFDLTPVSDEELNFYFDEIFRSVSAEEGTLHYETALNNFLCASILKNSGVPPVPAQMDNQDLLLDKAQKYLANNFKLNITLNELAEISCLSPFHFHRLYVDHFGTSPHEDLMKFRIVKSIELLSSGCSSSEAGIATGFADQSHFSRNFKKNVGVTPGKFVSSNIIGATEAKKHL